MRKSVFLAIVLIATGAVATGAKAQDGISFLRGDANLDLEVNLTDAVYILNNLFMGGVSLPCAEAADVNGDAARGGTIDLSDGVYLLNFLFLGGQSVPAPFPECGATKLVLGCENTGCPDTGPVDSSCEAMDVEGVGLCRMLLGFYWDGESCQSLGGCDCAGDDCGELYDSIRSCEAAHVDCVDVDPEPVSCEAMDVNSEGICAAILGYYWDGRGCRTLAGCDCSGGDCEDLYDSIDSCEAAHIDCGPGILPGDCDLRQDGCLVVNERAGCYQIRARNGRLLNLAPGRNERLLASLGDGWCGTFMLSLCRTCEVACNNTLVTGPVFSVCAVRGREDAEIEPVPDVIGPVERPGPVDIEPVERPDPNAAPAVAVPVRGE
ncbi:MAG: dockerin type I repeat-containing protein [Planctomycetota bacterium]|nr:dockerin type I repeat-containing protein [Planctomycetota bacterium]